MGFQPTVQLESPLNQYAKFQQIQSGQQANELARMQMQEYQRGLQEQEGLRNYLAGVSDINAPEAQTGALRFGTAGATFAKQLAERAKEQAALKKTQAETESSQFDLGRKRLAVGYQAVSSAKSGADVMAALDEGVKLGYFSQDQANAQKAEVAGLQTMPEFQKWQAGKLQQFVSAEKQLEMSAPKPQEVKRADGSIIFLDSNPNSPTFKQEVMPSQAAGMTPADAQRLANERVRLGYEGQRVGLENRRIAVAEQNAQREADPAFQQRMANARATGEAIAKGDIKAVQELPKIVTRAEEGLRLIDEMIGKRDQKTRKLLQGEQSHPGFENAVGATWMPGARFVPGTDAANFMARFDQIKGASFLEAFESLKGGGSITEKEGTKATSAINRMSTSTDEKEFIRAAMDLQEVIRNGVRDARSKADRAGSGQIPLPSVGGARPTSPGPASPLPPKSSGGLTPEEQAELAQLRARYPKKGP